MGGTSLAAPAWAALIAVADQGRVAEGGTTLDGATQTLPALYSLPSADFHDITSGSNGTYQRRARLRRGHRAGHAGRQPRWSRTSPSTGWPTTSSSRRSRRRLATAGSAFGLTVEVESPDGSLVTGATGTLTIALANNPGGGSLGGTLTATIDQGVATFSGLPINQAGAGYTLTVSGGRPRLGDLRRVQRHAACGPVSSSPRSRRRASRPAPASA